MDLSRAKGETETESVPYQLTEVERSESESRGKERARIFRLLALLNGAYC